MLLRLPKWIVTLIAASCFYASLSGCSSESAPSNAAPTKAAQPSKVVPSEPTPVQNSQSPAKASPLTEEELELIAANPKDLPPELRRKRAFALRKKVMQNPDSPTAKQLEEIRRAIEAGEIDPQVIPRPSQANQSTTPSSPPISESDSSNKAKSNQTSQPVNPSPPTK